MEGEHVVLCVGTEPWEELKKTQVLEMEEHGGSHERTSVSMQYSIQDTESGAAIRRTDIKHCKEVHLSDEMRDRERKK